MSFCRGNLLDLLFKIHNLKSPRLTLKYYLCDMDYPSKVLAKAVEEISGLPGIGKKSALRLALHLLKQPESQAVTLGESLKNS